MLFSSSHRWPNVIAPVLSSMASFALLALPASKLSSPPILIGACCPAVVGEGEVLALPPHSAVWSSLASSARSLARGSLPRAPPLSH
ncbi:hypothetical protein BHE74_00005336 [Ensete ventricosum]|nr:hypothetical protein BHE74_00005336 [Ensete ventricosum]